MSVDEWAEEKALESWPDALHDRDGMHWRIGYKAGAKDLAALLLSDKVARAMSDSVLAETGELFRDYVMRAAMQAALTKITEDKE